MQCRSGDAVVNDLNAMSRQAFFFNERSANGISDRDVAITRIRQNAMKQLSLQTRMIRKKAAVFRQYDRRPTAKHSCRQGIRKRRALMGMNQSCLLFGEQAAKTADALPVKARPATQMNDVDPVIRKPLAELTNFVKTGDYETVSISKPLDHAGDQHLGTADR
jgi:hypothetical protein